MPKGTPITFLTVEQAAEALNLKVTTIRYWLLHKKITYHKLRGRSVRIPQHEIDRIIQESVVERRSA